MILNMKYLLPILLLPLWCSCGRYQSPVPDFPVHLERDLNTLNCLFPGDYWMLTSPHYAVDATGYAGVLLVKGFDGAYYAFDLCCPVEASQAVRVGKPDEVLCVSCPKCGETYDLGFGQGTPMNGISEYPLKRYTVYLPSYQAVLIRN